MLSISGYNNSTRSSSQGLFPLVQNRYERYAQKKGWKFEVVDITESDLKGYKVISLANFNFFFEVNILYIYRRSSQEAIAAISGAGVYGKLKFESGIHRVQVFSISLPF